MDQEKKENRRKNEVIILFLITLFLSLFFYLKNKIPQILKELTTPEKIIFEKNQEK